MTSKLKKLQLENAKFEMEAPYNFCDRWCERCPQATRDRCSLYQEDFESKLQSMAQGKDPNDWKNTFEAVQKNLEKTNVLLESIAKKEGIDLAQKDYTAAFEEKKQREKELYKHPLFKQAMGYSDKLGKFLEQSYEREDEALPELIHDYESIIWYHTLMPPKVHRLLCDLFIPDETIDSLKENEEDMDIRLCDALAQLEIIAKAVRESKKALQNIMTAHLPDRYVISDLIEILDTMNNHIEKILRDIDEGAL